MYLDLKYKYGFILGCINDFYSFKIWPLPLRDMGGISYVPRNYKYNPAGITTWRVY